MGRQHSGPAACTRFSPAPQAEATPDLDHPAPCAATSGSSASTLAIGSRQRKDLARLRELAASAMCGSMAKKTVKSEGEWRRELAPRSSSPSAAEGTERAFTRRYWDRREAGASLRGLRSGAIRLRHRGLDSGSGWPRLLATIDESQIETEDDTSHGHAPHRGDAPRAWLTSVTSSRWPAADGASLCINSVSLDFDRKRSDRVGGRGCSARRARPKWTAARRAATVRGSLPREPDGTPPSGTRSIRHPAL